MKELHLWPEEVSERNDQLEVSASLEGLGGELECLWYRLPVAYRTALTQGCDPFVLATLFTAMRAPADLVVHGQVSPTLLRNLEEYQTAWVSWYPQRYTRVEIRADTEREGPKSHSGAAVMGFSSGVDSSFTMYRHRRQDLGRAKHDLQAAIFVHGFDIALSRVAGHEHATKRAKTMSESLGVEMIPMAFNLKRLGDDWGHSHAAGLASCLMLLGGRFAVGLIASSYPYSNLQTGWGSNPVTDWMLSSGSFRIVHDGAGYTRYQKVCLLAGWPEALENLRVCLRDAQRGSNCCRCHKCVRVMLYFRFAGAGLPACFERDISDLQVARTSYPSAGLIRVFQEVLSVARAQGAPKRTVLALWLSLFLNRLRYAAKKSPLLRRIKEKMLAG